VPQSFFHGPRQTPRRSQRRTVTVAIVASALMLGGAVGAVFGAHAVQEGPASDQALSDQSNPVAGFPPHYSAPYLQISDSDAGDMAADMAVSGDKYYTLAFLIPASGCTAQWEDGGDPVGAFTSQVNALQAAGGNVIISFGGESGGELAQTCTSVSALTAAYANVVSTYGANRLDFDIEGAVLSDTASNSRRDQALAALQAEDPSVQVDYTLPVNPTGLSSAAMGLLQDAQSNGVKVSAVNIMTMDFGNGQDPLADSISAAKATAGQLSGLYGISITQAYGMMGLTPFAGQNDDDEFFSQSDASSLEGFAASEGIEELSFWEVDGSDKPTGYAFSKIFDAITSGNSGAPSPAPSNGGTPVAPSPAPSNGGTPVAPSPAPSNGGTPVGPITGMDGLCVDVRGANTADFTPVQVFTCNETNAQQWTLASNNTIQALGECLGVHHGGTTNGTAVDLYHCNNSGGQVWQPLSDGAVFNPQAGKCLDETNWSTTPGTQLQIWSCTDAANQRWTLPGM
jgi:chitinase